MTSTLSEWLERTYEALELLVEPGANRTAAARAALDEVRHEFSRTASLFGPIIEAGRSKVEDLERTRDALGQRAASLQTERDSLRAHVDRLEPERDALRHRVSNLEQHAASLEQHAKDLGERVVNLSQETLDLRQQVSSFELRREADRRALAGATHHVEALLGSASWRVTAPLRAIVRVFKGLLLR